MAHELDSVDKQIIRLLQEDGRRSNVEIARRIGVAEATVRKRLERLLAEGVIQIVAIPDPAKVGFPTSTVIGLQVDLGKVGEIGDRLAQMEEVRSVKYTTGEYDIVVEALFQSDEQLLEFLTNELASIPGVRRAATSHVLKVVKGSEEWVLPKPPPPRILVVDDDPDFVEATSIVLEAEGYVVDSAASGREALAKMRQSRPDLVILDIMMEGILDGLRASKEMEVDKTLREVPILIVSSITSSEYIGMFPTDEYLHADNFLSKPVEPARLLAEVKRLLKTSRRL